MSFFRRMFYICAFRRYSLSGFRYTYQQTSIRPNFRMSGVGYFHLVVFHDKLIYNKKNEAKTVSLKIQRIKMNGDWLTVNFH